MRDLGDRAEDATIDFTFHTTNASAAPTTLAGTPAISVYKANGTTQSTAGITLTVDFDSVTGLNHVRIDTSADAFYATGNDYSVVITAGTVNSISVVGATVATFSIENRFMRGTNAAALAASMPSAAAIADAVWDEAQSGHVTAGSFGEIATEIAAILVDTAEIGAAGAGLTAVPWNASWDAEVQSECNDALVAIHLDHLLAVDYDPASKPGTSTALLNELIGDDGGVSQFTTNALENGPSGSGASAAAIADAVWDEAQSGHVTAGTFGAYLDAAVTSRLAPTTTGRTLDISASRACAIDLALLVNATATLNLSATTIKTATDIETDTQDIQTQIGTAGAGLTTVPWNAAWDAEVQSEVQDAIEANHLDHLLAVDYDPASKPGVSTALLNELIGDDSGVSQFTANALENGPSGGGGGGDATEANQTTIIAHLTDIKGTSFVKDTHSLTDILADTAEIGAAGAGLTDLGGMSTGMKAEVESEVNDALVAIHLDHLLAVDYDPASKPGTSTALLNELIGDDGGVSQFTSNALENATSATAAAIADAVWDELQAGHVTAGSFGEIATEIAAILVDTAEIGAAGAGLTAVPWNASWDAEVQSECNDALVAIHLDHLLAVDYDPTAKPGVSTALLNEIVEDDGGVSRFTTNALENAPGASAAAIADAVWDEAQSGHVTAGSFGEIATEIAAILVDTAEIGAAGAGLTAVPWNAAWDAEVQSEVNDALVAFNVVATSNLPTNFADLAITATTGRVDVSLIEGVDATNQIRDAIVDDATRIDASALNILSGHDPGATLSSLTAAQVNAEIVDALDTDTYAELGAVPAATASLSDKIAWLFMLARNKVTQTATTTTVRNDADSGNVATSTVSDNGTTATRGEFS